jgi:hypothetical protein
MTEELEKHVYKKYDIIAKLGKGVSELMRALQPWDRELFECVALSKQRNETLECRRTELCGRQWTSAPNM